MTQMYTPDDAARDDARPPLNGFTLLGSFRRADGYVVLVDRGVDAVVDRFVVATVDSLTSPTWHSGTYCSSYESAVHSMMAHAGWQPRSQPRTSLTAIGRKLEELELAIDHEREWVSDQLELRDQRDTSLEDNLARLTVDVNERLAAFEQKIETLGNGAQTAVDALDADVSELKYRVHTNDVNGSAALAKLEDHVDQLQARLVARLDRLEQQLDQRVDELEENVHTLSRVINGVVKQVEAVEDRLAQLEAGQR